MKGVIKKVNQDNGYGFIKIEGGKDVFFHANDCSARNFKEMKEGDMVSFETEDSAKGPKAVNVTLDSGSANNNDSFAEDESAEEAA